jgi:hypothetical protein
MRPAALGLTLLLAACGGPATLSTDDPAAQNVAAATANGTPAIAAAASECGAEPDFVRLYRDAVVIRCTAGAPRRKHASGTIVYTSAADPQTLLGWSRAQANASGLGQRLLTESSYSAGEETKRSLTVVVEPQDSGTKVTVNWGRDL